MGVKLVSLVLKEEHRLRVFKNRVLGKIFGPKRDEVIGGWRKVHSEELHNLDSSPSVIRMTKSLRWVGHIECMGVMINAYKILVGKPKRRPVRRSGGRWEDNIKI
jgi:hypothetical protein